MRGTIRSRLVLLALFVLLPSLVSGAVLLRSAYQHERQGLERQIGDQARALGLVLDRQLGQDRVLLQALSASEAFRRGDWAGFDQIARRATLDRDTSIVVREAGGRALVDTRIPKGMPLPVNSGLSAMSWGEPLEQGTRISDLYRSQVSGLHVVVADRRIRLDNGQTVHLAVTTPARAFDRLWADQRIPSSWIGAVVDRRGAVVTRSRRPERFVGRVASDSMQDLLRGAPEGVAETTTLDGVRSVTGWSRSPLYGWSFILAAPRNEIVGAARESLTLAALTGLALMAVGVALALGVARRIALPMERLTTAARDWEAGRQPIPAPCGVAEIDALAEALAQSAARLAARTAELQELNASLETRVAERSHELEAATESLVQAQKLEAIGRLTGGVAHDFNNLLMAVSGNLDLLKRRISDETLLRYVAHARQAAERGAKLTGQLLAFSRKQRLEPRALDINCAVVEAQELLVSTLRGAVRVETVLAPDLWPAMADPTQLELVILNLAINARDAMPAGGVVTIETRNVTRQETSARPESPPAGEFVMVAVSDTGTGMTPEVAARVFEPFFTTKAVGQGSGLGLPQVLGLAKQLGGGVEIVTAPGHGATVKVFLPRASAAVAAPLTVAEGPAPDLAGLRVLLVDDDPDVRAVTKAMLEESGCAVVEASSGRAALEIAETAAALDVALVDFAMPGMSGIEAVERLNAERRSLPVVMMSGYADADLLTARWRGPLLHKPFSASSLGEELARAAVERSAAVESR